MYLKYCASCRCWHPFSAEDIVSDEFIDEDGVVLTREEFRGGLGKGRVRQVLNGFEASVVDQSKAADADLNVLVRRWMRGEPVPQFTEGQFGDVSEAVTFQEMQERLLVVDRAFLSLPAYVRERFGNSPVAFADAMVDPSRREEMEELGLLEKPAEPARPVEAAPAKPAVAPPEGAGPGDGGVATDRKS